MSNRTGWSEERRREFEALVAGFREEGRYGGREDEVAARIVNKQRHEYGETDEARAEDARGESPDRDLPIEDFDELTIDEIEPRLGDLPTRDLREVEAYEREHKDRKGVVEPIERRLDA